MSLLDPQESYLSLISEYFLYVLSPLIFGICIYLSFRTNLPSILFTFANWMPITLPVYDLGKNWSWLVFNLPDALWSFSFTNFLMLSSKNNSLTVRNMYLIFGVLVMLASEVAQGSFLNGTFDLLDIVAISIGVAISFFLLRSSTRKSSATI